MDGGLAPGFLSPRGCKEKPTHPSLTETHCDESGGLCPRHMDCISSQLEWEWGWIQSRAKWMAGCLSLAQKTHSEAGSLEGSDLPGAGSMVPDSCEMERGLWWPLMEPGWRSSSSRNEGTGRHPVSPIQGMALWAQNSFLLPFLADLAFSPSLSLSESHFQSLACSQLESPVSLIKTCELCSILAIAPWSFFFFFSKFKENRVEQTERLGKNMVSPYHLFLLVSSQAGFTGCGGETFLNL